MTTVMITPPYDRWTVYTDPVVANTRKTKKETEKHFRGLKWANEAYYCEYCDHSYYDWDMADDMVCINDMGETNEEDEEYHKDADYYSQGQDDGGH